ncbi:Ero1-like protein [Chionoecetes opilio]|uniref:Ero1-like protein n=1 Tax=Chionoecetes opilio TaxID=41210 RepID=A0A8J4YMQ7_CHIOP|nr:Ero1-like protein [Chionoecetes opilio]
MKVSSWRPAPPPLSSHTCFKPPDFIAPLMIRRALLCHYWIDYLGVRTTCCTVLLPTPHSGHKMYLCRVLLLGIVVLEPCWGQFFGGKQVKAKTDTSAGERCFCQLKGAIDDCSCSVETIDSFNNWKVYPRLNSLLQQVFFRYWKVNLNKKCPFWEEDGRCAIRFCSVQPCTDQEDFSSSEDSEILHTSPINFSRLIQNFVEGAKTCEKVPEGLKGKAGALDINKPQKRPRPTDGEDCDEENDLGYLNTTLSKESIDGFERWAAHDNFCFLDDDDSEDSKYVDLLLNPERYTGYTGPSAHRIWRTIYQENCFKPSMSLGPYADFSNIGDLCLEKRAFYRAVSGLHSSINIHLCARYLLSDKSGFDLSSEGIWGHNVEEFQRRFDPQLTGGEGPKRLKNLYFLYLLELRALAKAAPYLETLEYYTGNEEEDKDVKMAVKDLLSVVKSFPEHFNEHSMFNGGLQAAKLKEEFREHFRNISRIMDCVGCDKCRLWGKLQITGLGTALKILFSGNFDHPIDQQLNLSVTKPQHSRVGELPAGESEIMKGRMPEEELIL